MQRAKSFIDALVYVCVGPSYGGPGIHNPIEYVRPKLIERIVPVKRAKPISLASTSSAGRPVVVVSDDSDEEAEIPTLPSEPSPPPPVPSERIVTIPAWVTGLLNDGNPNGKSYLS